MTDETIGRRAKRHQKLREAQGWRKVTVWVPTLEDAADVRRYAARKRARAEAVQGLSSEVDGVTKQTEERIAAAIAQHGSGAYITPSGPVLTLMTKLADEGDLVGFAKAVNVLCRAKPANAAFVLDAIPAKISNSIIRRRGINSLRLVKWAERNPTWADRLKRAVKSPERFQTTVEEMVAALNAS